MTNFEVGRYIFSFIMPILLSYQQYIRKLLSRIAIAGVSTGI